jgi:hypothetical protein
MQSIGFLGPAFFLSQLSHVKTPAMAVLCMACSQVLVSIDHMIERAIELWISLELLKTCLPFFISHLPTQDYSCESTTIIEPQLKCNVGYKKKQLSPLEKFMSCVQL